MIQTDDQTLDELYATFRAYAGGAATRAMPNTLDLIAKRGDDLQPLLRLLPALLPLAGQPADRPLRPQPQRPRQRPAQRRLHRLLAAARAYTHNLAIWLQGAGYRTIHIGKFLNGYGDEPYDDGTTVPPGWSAWHTVLNADTDHYFYGYTLNNNGTIDGPFGDSGQLGNPRIRRPRRHRLPVRADSTACPATTRPTR